MCVWEMNDMGGGDLHLLINILAPHFAAFVDKDLSVSNDLNMFP